MFRSMKPLKNGFYTFGAFALNTIHQIPVPSRYGCLSKSFRTRDSPTYSKNRRPMQYRFIFRCMMQRQKLQQLSQPLIIRQTVKDHSKKRYRIRPRHDSISNTPFRSCFRAALSLIFLPSFSRLPLLEPISTAPCRIIH